MIIISKVILGARQLSVFASPITLARSRAHCLPIPPRLYLAAQPSARSSQTHFISASPTHRTYYAVIKTAAGLKSKYRVVLGRHRSSCAHVVTTRTAPFFILFYFFYPFGALVLHPLNPVLPPATRIPCCFLLLLPSSQTL